MIYCFLVSQLRFNPLICYIHLLAKAIVFIDLQIDIFFLCWTRTASHNVSRSEIHCSAQSALSTMELIQQLIYAAIDG
jgi:hypothetical protein